jgi:hypothetical protein
MARTTHVLEQLDPARRTAVCAVHGPVRIRRRMRLGSWLVRALNRSPDLSFRPQAPTSQNHRWTNDAASLPP